MPDSKNALSFPGCRTCLAKPCDRLRFGRVFPGKFLFIHKRYIRATSRDCPFAVDTFSEIRQLTAAASLVDFVAHIDDVFSQLSADECMTHAQNNYVSRYDDDGGRLALLEALWNDDVIGALRVPYVFTADKKLAQWLLANETLVYAMKQDLKKEKEEKAVTDSLDTQTQTITLSNPRWEHADAKRKEKSPDKAAVGDTVVLIADVTVLAEGATVNFPVYDASADPVMRIETVAGKNEGGVAKAQWTVSTGNESGDIRLEFEASAKGKMSERCKIDVQIEEMIGAIAIKITSLFDSPLKDISCEVSDGTKSFGTTATDDQGIVVWDNLPFGSYTITIKNAGQSIEMPIVWMPNANRPFLFKMKEN
jgi:hypothetical protein